MFGSSIHFSSTLDTVSGLHKWGSVVMVSGFRNRPHQRFDERILMVEILSGKINMTKLIGN